MKMIPVLDRCILSAVNPPETEVNGILLPTDVRELPQEFIVLAVGPGRRDDHGELVVPEVQVGDRVLIAKHAGLNLKQEGEPVKMVNASEIMAKIVDDSDVDNTDR